MSARFPRRKKLKPGLSGKTDGEQVSLQQTQLFTACGENQAEVPVKHYFVLTDEGIEKNKNFKLERADIDRVKAAVKRVAGEKTAAA